MVFISVALGIEAFPPLNYYNFMWQGAGWKIVACFEGRFPDRMKQLPLDRHFDINNVKRVRFENWFADNLFLALLCIFIYYLLLLLLFWICCSL